MKKFLILPTLLLLLSCAQNKKTVATGSTSSQTETSNQSKSIEGTILEIIQGKDGYTAKMKGSNTNEIYFVTISRTNLKNPNQYKTVAVGDKLKITGDYWKTEKEQHITVREIAW